MMVRAILLLLCLMVKWCYLTTIQKKSRCFQIPLKNLLRRILWKGNLYLNLKSTKQPSSIEAFLLSFLRLWRNIGVFLGGGFCKKNDFFRQKSFSFRFGRGAAFVHFFCSIFSFDAVFTYDALGRRLSKDVIDITCRLWNDNVITLGLINANIRSNYT